MLRIKLYDIRKILFKCFPIFLLFICQISLAENQITGKIVSNDGICLENIHILLQKENSGGIIAFGISNSKGEYTIRFETGRDSIFLKTQSLNYAVQQLWLTNKNQIQNFTLFPEVKELKEVRIKASPIRQHGDTISYSVGAFAGKNDQVIADVINKLPGLEVESDGRILYQGTPIRKFYIEGMDLLEGKYNLANNNLPAESVASVQVLENHEPIKLLRNITSTDKASLNIKLKRNIAMTGKAKLGIGASPMLWDANITPMLFNKKQQLICSYQANNMGKDVAMDLKTFSIEDLMDMLDNNTEKEELLGIQNLSTPNFNTSRYLNNNIHLLSTNYLLILNHDLQLRVNSSYLNDYQKHNGGSRSEYHLGNDTIILQEKINNRLTKRSLINEFTLSQNSDRNYLKNTLKIQAYWDKQLGHVSQNNSPIRQDYQNPFQSFSNKLKWIKPLGKKMWQLASFVSYNKAPQSLLVKPGVYEDIFNSGKSYDAILQEANNEELNINHSISLINKIKRWSLTHKIGYQHQQKDFDSRIYLNDNLIETDLGKEFQNQLNFRKNKIYGNESIQYITERFKLYADLPLSYTNYNISDKISNISTQKNTFLFQPKLRLNYEFNAFFTWKNTWKKIHKVGDSRRINYANVLENYRRLQKQEAILGETKGQSMGTTLHYKNPLSSIFAYAGYTYMQSEKDLILHNQIQNDGSMLLQMKKNDNRAYSHNVFAQASKYISNWKTNFSLKSNYMLDQQKMFLNESMTPIQNENFSLNGKITSDVFSWMNLEYKNQFSWLMSKVDKGNNNKVKQQSHIMNLMIYPKDNHYFGCSSEYLKNEGSENIFLDLIYNYTLKNKQSKIEIRWTNIFNKSSYSNYFVDEYSIVNNYYELRPSQIQLNYSFSF
ncbi:hypothetical protein DWB61_13260 [Ancylomarina euxinus]|uniref:TonB-dependent receptor n=1 Tax=Ancylomarina euxinus TaxID=2283627 RepID=A0A425XZ06_9BACT|nr:hypothetical protein [Ancylomarina euxinus]MCZ4695628.1 hypothetical protein [Ancylomarina euxinus]MUP16068.1 hypothetical protein [Ancylomarina euxinus]RRG20312.1 hypothetical protein DWB61_13260 [Ancylomarina euxinus]